MDPQTPKCQFLHKYSVGMKQNLFFWVSLLTVRISQQAKLQILELLLWIVLEDLSSANEVYMRYCRSPNDKAMSEIKSLLNPDGTTLRRMTLEITERDFGVRACSKYCTTTDFVVSDVKASSIAANGGIVVGSQVF